MNEFICLFVSFFIYDLSHNFLDMDYILKTIVEKYESTDFGEEDILHLFNDTFLHYLQKKYYTTRLKSQAITQLGYSRGGTNACLPDELIEQIKLFVFHDLTDKSIQERKVLSIFKEFEFDFILYWAYYRNHHCDCRICFQNCVVFVQQCMLNNICTFISSHN